MKHFATTEKTSWQIVKPTQPGGKAIRTTLKLNGLQHQTWEGFGGCFNELSQIALQKLNEEARSEIYDDLFSPQADGLRLNFCRLPIGASDYAVGWYSHNETPGDFSMENFSVQRDEKYLLPYLREALKRNPDMKLFASPWSPPTWMKEPPVHNYGTLIRTPENLEAYALYLMKFITAYAEKGIRIDQIHIQNEPVSTQKFPSCIWTGEEFAEFIGQYLGPLFERNGLKTQIWLGTLNGPETDHRTLYTRFNDYANLVLHDPDANRYIHGVSYQWAGKYALAQTKEAFPEKQYMQTENECGDGKNSWEYARYVYELFQHYIAGGVCAYVYWNMVLQQGGRSSWGWNQNSMVTVHSEKGGSSVAHREYEFYVMKHFSRFVQRGAIRLGLDGHLSSNCVCFENPDGSRVLIAQNPFAKPLSFVFEEAAITLPPDSINTLVFEA